MTDNPVSETHAAPPQPRLARAGVLSDAGAMLRPRFAGVVLVGATALLSLACGASDAPPVDNDPRLVGIWDTGCQDANVTLIGVVRQRQQVTFTATDYAATWEFYGGVGCTSPYLRFSEAGSYRTGSIVATAPDLIALDLEQTSFTALNYPDAPTRGACFRVTLVDGVETSIAGAICDGGPVPANGDSLSGAFQFTDETATVLRFAGGGTWSQVGGTAPLVESHLPAYTRL